MVALALFGPMSTGLSLPRRRVRGSVGRFEDAFAYRGLEAAIGSPALSVIVPVYEQWPLVGKLLERLADQQLPAEAFELILVENGSSEVAIPSSLPANVRLLHTREPGAYAARNVGAAAARGGWLVFTDADCLPQPDWLTKLALALDEHPEAALLAGRVDVVAGGEEPNAFEVYDMLRGIPQAHYVRNGYAATANLMISRQVFEELGGFDASRFSGGDAAFCRKAAAAGHRIVYVDGAVVEHPARHTWASLARKARRVKGGQMAKGTPLRYSAVWRVAVPPVVQSWRFMQQRQRPLRQRLAAVAVQAGLWVVEIAEVLRLLTGGPPQRR